MDHLDRDHTLGTQISTVFFLDLADLAAMFGQPAVKRQKLDSGSALTQELHSSQSVSSVLD